MNNDVTSTTNADEGFGESNSLGAERGGRTTNSPPCKRLIWSEKGFAVASGVDGLTIAVDFHWRDASIFKVLDALKAEAAEKECPMPALLKSADGMREMAYEVKPFGKEGYQWVLTSPEYAIKLGNWTAPRSRPSAMIDFRSETLWMHGLVESIDRILTLLQSVGAHASNVRASRIDVCVDLMIQAGLWDRMLEDHAVTRARNKCARHNGRDFTGFEFGGNEFRCRIYDKDLEIRQKSKKVWMYDIWNIDELPEQLRVIRVEFQLRREILRELGIDTIWSFVNHPRNLWAYCTHCWLKFTDDPQTETRFQVTLPFWETVQEGFMGGQCGNPLIRAKAVNVSRKQLAQQLMGQFTSLIAIGTENMAPCVRLEDHLAVVSDSAQMLGMDDYELSQRVRMKKGKYLKAIEKFDEAEALRRQHGLPIVGRKAS